MSIASLIIPAIIPHSYDDLRMQVAKIAGLPEIHIDVVDGIFAPTASWPYLTGGEPSTAFDLLARFSLEVDLMVATPLSAARSWLAAGADQLVFHIETISVAALKDFTKESSVTVGVAISSATPLEALYPYLPYVDYVQVMGIAEIGSQGQPFDQSVLGRISALTAQFPNIPLSIDGSVNLSTLRQLQTLSVRRYIVGSAIMGAASPREAYDTLTNLLQS